LWLTLESGRIGIAAQGVGMARAALEFAIGHFEEWSATDEQIAGNPELVEERGAADVPADRGSAVGRQGKVARVCVYPKATPPSL
jgi:alkylation response protein AidB-like acyl-CoA dehydrogenase